MKIDLPIIKIFYIYAVSFYNNEISLKQVKVELKAKGITPSSANYYLYAYQSFIEGRIFKGTINADATKYYLDRIYETKGLNYLKNALQALSLHIDYYKSVSNANVISQKNILDEYLIKYKVSYDDYFEEEINKEEKLKEGFTKQITVNIYERNSIARTKCIEHFGSICKVCDFDFEKKYGEIGNGFIHVHHIVDISLVNDEYEVDYTTDLIPVCPNCHAMLHKKKPAYKIEELKRMMK